MSLDIFLIYPTVTIESAAPCEKLVPGGSFNLCHQSRCIGVYLQCLGTGPMITKKILDITQYFCHFPNTCMYFYQGSTQPCGSRKFSRGRGVGELIEFAKGGGGSEGFFGNYIMQFKEI